VLAVIITTKKKSYKLESQVLEDSVKMVCGDGVIDDAVKAQDIILSYAAFVRLSEILAGEPTVNIIPIGRHFDSTKAFCEEDGIKFFKKLKGRFEDIVSVKIV